MDTNFDDVCMLSTAHLVVYMIKAHKQLLPQCATVMLSVEDMGVARMLTSCMLTSQALLSAKG